MWRTWETALCKKWVCSCPRVEQMREEICFQVPRIICKCQEHIFCRAPCPLRSEEDCVSPSAYRIGNTRVVMRGWTLNILISHFSCYLQQLLLEGFQCHSSLALATLWQASLTSHRMGWVETQVPISSLCVSLLQLPWFIYWEFIGKMETVFSSWRNYIQGLSLWPVKATESDLSNKFLVLN